jgi:hypothetical protein
MSVAHRLEVRKNAAFFRHVLSQLAGGAVLSLEGDLSQCKFDPHLVAATDETGLLKRNTIWPRQDFVALHLEPDNVDAIFKEAMAAGFKRGIIHIQVERKGELQFASYDNFSPGGVWAGPSVPESFLQDLRSTGVIANYELADKK